MKKSIIIFLISTLFLAACSGFDDDAPVVANDGETMQVGFAMTRADVVEGQTFGFYAYLSRDLTVPDGLQPKNLNNGWGTYYYTTQYPALVPCIVDKNTGAKTSDYDVKDAMEISSGIAYLQVATPGMPMVIYDGYYQVRYPRTTPLKILDDKTIVSEDKKKNYCEITLTSYYQINDLTSLLPNMEFVEQRAKFSFRFIQGAGSPIKISDCYVLNAGTFAYLHPNTRVITITGQGEAGSEAPFVLEDKNNSAQGQVSYASAEDGSQDVYLFPGDYTATYLSDLKLSFKLQIGAGVPRTIELPISMQLLANNRYIFNVTVSTQFIELTCQQAQWDAKIDLNEDVGKVDDYVVGTFSITDWETGTGNTDAI